VTGSLFQDGRAHAGYVRVAIERSFEHEVGLTYARPAGMGELHVGERVVAPLGRGDRPTEGVVIEILPGPGLDPARIKPILRRTDVRLPERLVELARWMARYYCCPLGVTLSSMAPAAVKRGTGGFERTVLVRTGAEPAGKLPKRTAEAWEAIQTLPESVFPAEARALAARFGMANAGPINRLESLGLLRAVQIAGVRAREDEEWLTHAQAPEPTADQRRALDAIEPTLGGFAAHLLRGVTGSGKTEVYLRLIEDVLAAGRCAIVLVPEISLTPQTVARFRGRLGAEHVAVLHSGLTSAQRHQQWRRVATGAARVVVGARSAIFAPFDARAGSPLGLIVVDEEHDGAYKQDQAPRYHARDVAVKRAQIESCPVILGSATPSLESWRNAVEGRFHLHELRERPAGAALPKVEVVDLARERLAHPWRERNVSLVGPTLERAIAQTLERGRQVILLLNRRGFANYLCCPDARCGWVAACAHCDSTLVLHKSKEGGGGFVRCHHCLAEQKTPAICPDCGTRLAAFGVGTQRVEGELARRIPALVPGETMLRLDSDAIRRAADWRTVFGRFESGEVKALLGTQLIAKGLDFPNVGLVGVLNADTAIDLPDFRAEERTFQLISQVAGRAGRTAESVGRVVVQTLRPGLATIRHAAAHDYLAFAREELERRKAEGVPPCARMARVVVRDRDHTKAFADAQAIAQALAASGAPLRMHGPHACPLSRVADHHRVAVELYAESAGPIQQALASARSAGLLKSDARTGVDVDPIALL